MTLVGQQRLIVVGGEDDDITKNDTWAGTVSSEGVAWQQLAHGTSAAFAPRQSHEAVCYNDRVLVFGGGDMIDHIDAFDEMHLGDGAPGEWCALKTSGAKPSARSHHGMTLISEVVYVYGGFDGMQYLNDLYALDMRTMKWECLLKNSSERVPPPVSQAYMIVGGGEGRKRD
eukprot:Tamp_30592.p1 GENE.Tamp_30592~~Tamp_30592.p1  ORF type:complete len:190 (+),score=41.85 Tamp_30592:56-571(+)